MKRLAGLAAIGLAVGSGYSVWRRWRAHGALPFSAEAEALQKDLDQLLDAGRGLAEILDNAEPRDAQVLRMIWSLVEAGQEHDDVISVGAMLGQVLDLCDQIADGITPEETETRLGELPMLAKTVQAAAKDSTPGE